MSPQDRVVILTGATQGIGLATAYCLANAGCRLALAARNVARLEQLAHTLNFKRHTAEAIPTDMGNTAQATQLVEHTIAAFGKVDIVVNNAALGLRDNVADMKEVDARSVMDINYFGPVTLIQAAIPHLRANADGGLIINVSSIVGQRAMPGIAGYCASKGALQNMANSLRLELKADNIRVSTVYPGVTKTQFNDRSLGSSQQGRGRLTGHPPEQVAQAILKAIKREPRDVYVTLFDRTFVTVSLLFPGFMDRLLSLYLQYH